MHYVLQCTRSIERRIYEHIINDKRRPYRGSDAWGGGTSLEALSRIAVLEKELSDLKQTIATPDTYGLSKITDATDVTENNGLVLGAVQNNASVPGTLANKIQSISESMKFKRAEIELPDISVCRMGDTFCFFNETSKLVILHADLYLTENISIEQFVPVARFDGINFNTVNIWAQQRFTPYYCDCFYNGLDKTIYAWVNFDKGSPSVFASPFRFQGVAVGI